jgi:hypothetical protein
VPCRFERRADKASTVRVCHDVWAYLVAIRKFRQRQKAERRLQQKHSEQHKTPEASNR